MKIDDTLVDPHLESVPSLGTLPTRSFPGGDAKRFGWHTHGSLDGQLLILGRSDQIGTHLFEGANVMTGQGNPLNGKENH